MTTAIIIVCTLLAAAGCFFVVVGAFGMVRMPDIYSRIHAASITDTGGAALIIASLALYAGLILHQPLVVVKLLITYFFILFTSPTASHAVAKTALIAQVTPVDKNGKPVVDDELLKTSQRNYSTPEQE